MPVSKKKLYTNSSLYSNIRKLEFEYEYANSNKQ